MLDPRVKYIIIRGMCAPDEQANGKWSIRIFEESTLGESLDNQEFDSEQQAADHTNELLAQAVKEK